MAATGKPGGGAKERGLTSTGKPRGGALLPGGGKPGGGVLEIALGCGTSGGADTAEGSNELAAVAELRADSAEKRCRSK